MAPLSASLPDVQIVRSLERPLRADIFERAHREMRVSAQVALALGLDIPRGQIAERIGATGGEVRQALETLRRVAPAIEWELP